MIPNVLQQDFEVLPPEARQQVVDFVAFMRARYAKQEACADEPDDISSLFGILKTDKHVTLEEMDEAVARRGSEF